MIRYLILGAAMSFFTMGHATLPCPVSKRIVAKNGIYGELGGGSIFGGLGYTRSISGGYYKGYYFSADAGIAYAPEFINSSKPRGLSTALGLHCFFDENGAMAWIIGCAYTRLYYASDLENATFKTLTFQNYISPMIGLEYLQNNRFSAEMKFQPYNVWESGEYRFQPYLGVKLKMLWGETREGSYGGYYYW